MSCSAFSRMANCLQDDLIQSVLMPSELRVYHGRQIAQVQTLLMTAFHASPNVPENGDSRGYP